MIYAMNTRTTVPTDNPSANEFGHTLDGGCTFVYFRSTSGNGAFKVWSTYGDPKLAVGDRVSMTNDTGNGHRYMPEHVVTAVMTRTGLVGSLPAQKKIGYWVAK